MAEGAGVAMRYGVAGGLVVEEGIGFWGSARGAGARSLKTE